MYGLNDDNEWIWKKFNFLGMTVILWRKSLPKEEKKVYKDGPYGKGRIEHGIYVED